MMCSIQMNECESAHHSQDISVWSLISCMLLFAHSSQRPKHPLIASAMVVLTITSPATSSNPEIHIVWCYNDMCSLCRVVGGAEASAECLVDPGDMFAETEAERKAHSPPPSLVPRLHCIIAHKLTHSNPLLPSELAVPVQREGAYLTAAHKDTTILSFFFEVCACASLSKRHAVVCASLNSFPIPPLHP